MTFVLQMLETGKEESPIHALDPRAKLLWWICLIIVPIMVTNPYVLLAFTIWVWILAAIGKVAGRMYKFLIVFYPIMIGFIVLTWPFFYAATPDQHFLFNWSIFHASWEGIFYALAMGIRIILALTACTLFVMTTDLMNLASSIGQFLQEKFNISYMMPLMIISSFKFLPEMSGDYVTIINVFKSRALDMDSGSLFERMKKIVPVAIPLIDGMLARAQIIAIALELKAFNPNNKNRSFYYQHEFTWKDTVFVLSGVALIVLCVVLKHYGLNSIEYLM
jgi:energy-coupling factor transport system permease protein